MRNGFGRLAGMLWGAGCLAAVWASGAEPALRECFPARQLQLPQSQVEMTFSPSSNRANFTFFQGVTNVQAEGNNLRFTLAAGRAVLGWGNCQGTQPAPEVAGLWE